MSILCKRFVVSALILLCLFAGVAAAVVWRDYYTISSRVDAPSVVPVDAPSVVPVDVPSVVPVHETTPSDVARLYCRSCHDSLGGWTNILKDFEVQNDVQLVDFMIDQAEAGLMPPSEWHQKQLIKILNEQFGDRNEP